VLAPAVKVPLLIQSPPTVIAPEPGERLMALLIVKSFKAVRLSVLALKLPFTTIPPASALKPTPSSPLALPRVVKV